MDLIPQAGRLSSRAFTLGDQQIEDCGLIIGCDLGERTAILTYELCDSKGIEFVTFARLASFASAFCRPAWVNFVDSFTFRNQILGKSAPIIPRAFDPPLTRTRECSCPLVQTVPALRTVRPLPLIEDCSRIVKSEGLMQLLVSIYSNYNHCRLLSTGKSTGATGLSWGAL